MGFGFRRGIRLGKFARINLGKRGASLSLGVRGAHVNFGAKGVRSTVGIPGTGLSYSSSSSRTTKAGSGVVSGCAYVIVGVMALAIVLTVLAKCQADSAKSDTDGNSVMAVVLLIGLAVTGLYIVLSMKSAKRKKKLQAARKLAEAQEAERQARERWARLVAQYGAENAQRILGGKIWVGCTVAMMVEILGPPEAQDEKVLKTKVKRTYKYYSTGINRYSLRVFAENDEVIGWEDKDDI